MKGEERLHLEGTEGSVQHKPARTRWVHLYLEPKSDRLRKGGHKVFSFRLTHSSLDPGPGSCPGHRVLVMHPATIFLGIPVQMNLYILAMLINRVI